jgi:hypothetical protein
MRFLTILLLLVLFLSACGANVNNAPPEDTAKNLVAALIANDPVAILDTFDSAMSLRQMQAERLASKWDELQSDVSSGFDSCKNRSLGALQGHEILSVSQKSDTSAAVVVLLRYIKGDARLELDLRKTDAGWRVLKWQTHNVCED